MLGFLERLEEISSIEHDEVRNMEIEKILVEFSKTLKNCSDKTEASLGVRKSYSKSNEWWSEEMGRLKKLRQVSFAIYRIFKTEELRLRFVKARGDFKKQMKIEKIRVENIKARRLNLQFRQHRLIYWRSVKKLKREKSEPDIELEKLVEHFKPLLTENNK